MGISRKQLGKTSSCLATRLSRFDRDSPIFRGRKIGSVPRGEGALTIRGPGLCEERTTDPDGIGTDRRERHEGEEKKTHRRAAENAEERKRPQIDTDEHRWVRIGIE